MEWLKNPPVFDGIHDDRDVWGEYCLKHLETTLDAFSGLAQQKCWPAERWDGALHAWSKNDLLEKSWCAAAMLIDAEEEIFKNYHFAHSLALWTSKQWEKVPPRDDDLFFRLSRRIIMLSDGASALLEDSDPDPLAEAINSPVGMAAEGLLRRVFRNNNQQLNSDMRNLFTLLCNADNSQFRHARTLIASFSPCFFRIDEEWTKQTILPLFDWDKSEYEAHAAWYGFLWGPLWVSPLLAHVKNSFLKIAQPEYYKKFGTRTRQYVDLLVFLALHQKDYAFSLPEIRDATALLPPEGLSLTADVIVRRMNGVKERRGEYWRETISPYFTSVWPQHAEKATPSTAEGIAKICIAAEECFADAVGQLKDFLVAVERPDGVYYSLANAGLCAKFPEEALRLMAAISGEDAHIYSRDKLRGCLNDIQQSRPELTEWQEFAQLKKLCE